MANIDFPGGLRPLSNHAGTAPRITKYTRSGTGAIGENALLAMHATEGPIVAVVTTHDVQIIGVLAHYAAAADTDLLVYDDPAQEFLIQGDTAVTTPISVIGWYGPVIDSTTFNATTLQSVAQLNTSELTSTDAAGDVLMVRRLYDAADNDQDAADAKWVVKIRPEAHIFANSGTRLT